MLSTKEDILNNVGNQTCRQHPLTSMVFLSYYGINRCHYQHKLVNNILPNIFFCVQKKKETHTGLEQFGGEK